MCLQVFTKILYNIFGIIFSTFITYWLSTMMWYNIVEYEIIVSISTNLASWLVLFFIFNNAVEICCFIQNGFCKLLALCAENVKGKTILSILCFLCASFGAYTRIYLSQHFALDIFAGILIAVFSTLSLYYFLVLKTKNTQFWNWNVQKLRK